MTPVELLRRLIRYDTPNPPVNELECAFQSDDIEVELVRHDAGLAEPDLSLFDKLFYRYYVIKKTREGLANQAREAWVASGPSPRS